MTTKSLKKFTELLKRSEGLSIIPIIAIMVIMSVMGVVFTSIMGGWKVSAPMTINSNKAYNLAETAAMFALQEAYYWFNADVGFNLGTSTADPYVVSSITTGNVTEIADYWFERPNVADDTTTDTNDDVVNDDDDDSNSADDLDGDGVSDLYTIIATGRVNIGGATVAKRQIKVLATITDGSISAIAPGVHTDGSIMGVGANTLHFDIKNLDTGAYVTYDKAPDLPSSGSLPYEDGIIYRPAKFLDEDAFIQMSKDQGHYIIGNLSPGVGYPTASYYHAGTIPHMIYVTGNFILNGNPVVYGVYWIKGNTTVFNGNWQINGILIAEGDITLNGGGSITPNINGGIIQYGVASKLKGNGAPVDIDINENYFRDLDSARTIVKVRSWQEAVSAN